MNLRVTTLFAFLLSCTVACASPAEQAPAIAGAAPAQPATDSPTAAPDAQAPAPTPAEPKAPSSPSLFAVDCTKLVLAGDPRGASGTKWTYAATHEGVAYDLSGILRVPAGAGPLPAVVVSHGYGGSPSSYSARVAEEMAGWGLVAIGTQYSHAPNDAGLPKGENGASPENVARARATRALLGCLAYVDGTRVAAHGHSMGAFLTAELVGTYPAEFRVASHTAGGTNDGGAFATRPATAAAIRTPYAMHHGDADTTVLLRYDQNLAAALDASGVTHELVIYPGFGHADMALDATMFARVRAWYVAHGMF